MKRPITRARIIVNGICLFLGLVVILAVVIMGLTEVFLVGALFFFGVCIIPLTMLATTNPNRIRLSRIIDGVFQQIKA